MTASNLYATRIYSEHPVGLWPIDDELTFLSLINPAHRDVRSWNTGAATSIYSDFYVDNIQDPPFTKDTTYLVAGESGTYDDNGTTRHYIEILSQPLFNLYSETNHEQKVFSINAYLYHQLPAAYYEIGYLYEAGGNEVRFTERITPGPQNEWIRVGRTFDHNFEALDAKVFVRVYFSESTNLSFMINGLSVGHWSETQSSYSLGVYGSTISPNTGLPTALDQTLTGLELREYGPGLDTGYALIQDVRLLATNGGIPLVYGSNSVTTLIPSSDTGTKLPSIIVPGKGFLNADGRYNDYTLEAWVRIDNNTLTSKRIIGPIASADGIYVRGNTISVVIGDNKQSYYIGEWYRPMLLHLELRHGDASLLINGERVITIPFDQATIELPSNRLYNQDWIGFYSWEDVRVFELDTVSIFPYVVPSTVAKRRFVWGQGVESPESINSAYAGTPHTVDFAYANYSVNHSYPENARWDTGQTENLVSTKYSLSAPTYALPVIETGRRSFKAIMDYSKSMFGLSGGTSFVTFTGEGIIDPCYLYFSNINQISGNERSFYAIFSGTADSPVPLFVFINRQTGVTFRADIEGDVITYRFNDEVYQMAIVLPENPYVVGIDFKTARSDIVMFMSNPSIVELYIAGDQVSTFTGNVYRVGFCSEENHKSIAASFGADGIIDPTAALLDYIASYTLAPIAALGKYYLDVMIAGTWRDTFPLGYFATDGKIDLMQFNVDATDESSASVSASVMFSKATGRLPVAFDTIVVPDATGVIDLSKSTNYLSAMFSVRNNTVLVLPKGIDLNTLVMTLRLDVQVAGTSTNAFILKDMSISALTNNTDKFMELGTMHGHDIAPYSKVGNYYSNRIDKPWTIYKGSTPYLYLTNDSGIHPLSSIGPSVESGMWITMNKNRAREFKVSALQLWMKYSETSVPSEPVEIFSIRSDRAWIRFMCVDDGTGSRAKIYAVDGYTELDYTDIKFHQDGNKVIMPFIQNKHWTAIGIDFESLIDLSGDTGAICLLSSCVFNNIVYYQTTSLQEQYIFAYRTWGAVRNDGVQDLSWSYWNTGYNSTGATWDQVCKAETITHGVSIDEIYKTYVGTNRVVVDDDYSELIFDGGQATIISGEIESVPDQYQTRISVTHSPKWITSTIKPV